MTNKVSEILSKVDEDFRVHMYSNGFMFEVSGRDSEDEWATAKIVCNDIDAVVSLIKETVSLPRS
jgi:hypothetical protein